jgi:hypothetical protein
MPANAGRAKWKCRFAVRLAAGRLLPPTQAIADWRIGSAIPALDFRVANGREPVLIKMNNNERQTVLGKGH